MSSRSRPFFPTLDALRGVAAVLVMLRHVPVFPDLDFQESYLAVDLFFLLSGVVIANAYETRLLAGLSFARFAWTRATRIYPLYWLGSAAVLLTLWLQTHGLAAALGAGAHSAASAAAMLGLAFLMLPCPGDPPFPLNHPAWSLCFEILVNLLYATVVRALTTPRLLILIALCAIPWAGAVLDQDGLDFGYSHATLVLALWRVAFPFFCGILLYRLHLRYGAALARACGRGPLLRELLPWLLVAGAAAVLTASPDDTAPFDLAAVALVFPLLVFAALCVPEGGRGTAPARWLGLISYPLYMLHVPLSTLLLRSSTTMSAPRAWTFCAAALLVSWCAGRYVDAPLRRYLNGGARAGYAHCRRMATALRRLAG
jgi:peptidoglycan/LPS O-acetylase OafA/YrhL